MKAGSGQGGESEAARDLTVRFSAGEDRSALADLWVPGMTAVESIELQSAEYSDGSIWKLAGGMACRVKPEPFMLIAGR